MNKEELKELVNDNQELIDILHRINRELGEKSKEKIDIPSALYLAPIRCLIEQLEQ